MNLVGDRNLKTRISDKHTFYYSVQHIAHFSAAHIQPFVFLNALQVLIQAHDPGYLVVFQVDPSIGNAASGAQQVLRLVVHFAAAYSPVSFEV